MCQLRIAELEDELRTRGDVLDFQLHEQRVRTYYERIIRDLELEISHLRRPPRRLRHRLQGRRLHRRREIIRTIFRTRFVNYATKSCPSTATSAGLPRYSGAHQHRLVRPGECTRSLVNSLGRHRSA